MRYVTLGTFALLLACGAARAQAPDPQLMAPVQKFMDAFNKGDAAAAAATHLADADLAILDEVPPFAWRGAKAFAAWSAALDSDAKANGITEPAVTIAAPTRVETSGDQAYLVVPAVYNFQQRGVAMRENAQMTFVLKKTPGGWLIHAWTWTGPKPQPAGAAAKE
jgi:ketosteroid isomerase-like protein